ncbi:MAG: MFS transporter [Dehalococcoidia bacterium]
MRSRFSGLWRNPDFLRLWAGQTVSLFGSQVTILALPLTATLVLDATPVQMGLLGATGTLPFLLIGLFAGVWVDRLRRRPVLIAADLGRAVLLGSIPLAAALDQLTMAQLYAVSLLTGFLTVFFDVAYQAFLPSLVERRQLVEGNGKLEMSNSTARVAGPGLAGALTQLLSAPAAVLWDAISFLLSALFIGSIRGPEPAPNRKAERSGIWAEVREGLRLVLRDPLLRPLAISTAAGNLCTGVVTALFVLFLVETLHLAPAVIGLISAVGSVGALVSAMLVAPVTQRLGIGRALVTGKLLLAAGALLMPVAAGPAVVAAAVLTASRLVGTAGQVLSNVNQVSLRQATAPARLQGRVNATNRFLVWGTMPIGALLGGLLGEAIGVRPTLAVGAVGMALAAVSVLLSAVPSVREAPEAEGEAAVA